MRYMTWSRVSDSELDCLEAELLRRAPCEVSDLSHANVPHVRDAEGRGWGVNEKPRTSALLRGHRSTWPRVPAKTLSSENMSPKSGRVISTEGTWPAPHPECCAECFEARQHWGLRWRRCSEPMDNEAPMASPRCHSLRSRPLPMEGCATCSRWESSLFHSSTRQTQTQTQPSSVQLLSGDLVPPSRRGNTLLHDCIWSRTYSPPSCRESQLILLRKFVSTNQSQHWDF